MPVDAAGIKVAFVTLGCAKNEVDTEKMRARVLAAGMQLVNISQADCIVVNTCAFITEATEEAIATILDLANLAYTTGQQAKLVVTGCLPSRYQDELDTELPEVSAFVTVANEARIVEVILGLFGIKAQDARPSPDNEGSASINDKATMPKMPMRVPEDNRPWAYLKIAEGCSRRCSFCTIPSIRGPYVSTSLAELTDEADQLVAGGARELVLIAQDTGLWHDGEKDLADLLEHLAKRFENVWIRLMYLQPSALSVRLLETMAAHPNICRYLDIPLQHASARVISDMGRSGDASEYLQMIGQAREIMPDVALRTTVIAGFPGETRQESLELMRFIKAAKFDYVGVFVYSQEEGTVAGERQDQVPMRTRRARAQRLRDLADSIGFARAEALIGKRLEVLVTGYEDGQVIGRSKAQAPEIDGVVRLATGEPGQLLVAEVVDTVCYDLEAVVISEPR